MIFLLVLHFLLWARQGQLGLGGGCVVLLFTLSVAHCNWF